MFGKFPAVVGVTHLLHSGIPDTGRQAAIWLASEGSQPANQSQAAVVSAIAESGCEGQDKERYQLLQTVF